MMTELQAFGKDLILISASDLTLSPASHELMDSVRKNWKPVPLSARQGPEGRLPGLAPYGSGTMRAQRAELARLWSAGAQSPIWQGWGRAPHYLGETTVPTSPGGGGALGTFVGVGFESGCH